MLYGDRQKDLKSQQGKNPAIQLNLQHDNRTEIHYRLNLVRANIVLLFMRDLYRSMVIQLLKGFFLQVVLIKIRAVSQTEGGNNIERPRTYANTGKQNKEKNCQVITKC